MSNNIEYQVLILNESNSIHSMRLSELRKDSSVKVVEDSFNAQVEELTEVLSVTEKEVKKVSHIWVYYPWKKVLVKTLPDNEYRIVRLSRNNPLMRPEEQQSLQASTVAIAGLNVGNSGAVCMALEGGPRTMRFADFDIVSLSNMNRFRAALEDIGVNKAILTARQVLEIDPFLDLDVYGEGITEDNIDTFLGKDSSHKPDLLIEEVDNLELKLALREKARAMKIPVLMVTGNGSNIIIDVERYDTNQDTEILNGYLSKEVIRRIHEHPEKQQDKLHLARDFMGQDQLVHDLYRSFDLVGSSIAGIPQLAEATFLRGAALSYFTRKILANEVNSGRYHLNLDGIWEGKDNKP